jgi:group I intron endonuclease
MVTCLISDKRYIGICVSDPKDRWRSHCRTALTGRSETWLHKAIRKYGCESFTVVHIASSRTWDDACELEKALILQHHTHGPLGYNMTDGGDGTVGHKIRPEVLLRRSITMKGRKPSPDRIRRSAEGNRASWTPERRAKASEQARERMSDPDYKANLMASHKTPEYKAKMGDKARGRKLNPEQRAKISHVQRGRKTSPETRKRMSLSQTGAAHQRSEGKSLKCRLANIGREFSKETREKMAKAKTGSRQTPETIAKRSMALKGRVVPQEIRDKISASHLNRKRSAEQSKQIIGAANAS